MLTHVVLFKLRDRSAENISKTRDVLMTLPGKVPQIRHFEVGINVVQSDRAYDLALISRFDSLEHLKAYQAHPEHVEVLKYMQSVLDSSIAVDYED